MNNWSQRVVSRMKELRLTQEMLANKMGITRGAVTHYIAGRRVPPLKQFQKLAAILKADPAWLQYGAQNIANEKSKRSVTETSTRKIPLLSWEQIASYIDSKKIPTEEVKEFVSDFYTDQPHWYALRVKGDAMTSVMGKSFHAGDIIIVDPDEQAEHDSFVIALLPKSKEVTFKQYVVDGGVRYLKPLNPQYPIMEINESTHICGVIMGCLYLV